MADMDPYKNGSGRDGDRMTHHFRVSPGGFSEADAVEMSDPEAPWDSQDGLELLRDIVRVVLVEDFGMRPSTPCMVQCGSCQAHNGSICRLKSDPQPSRLPYEGCFEGIPKIEEDPADG